MYMDSNLYPFLQQLHAHIQWQKEKISQLDKSIEQLRQEIAALKERRQTTIDRVEYKFDQLKIEKLEGTLNIGFSPKNEQSIEDFAVNGKSMEDIQADWDSASVELYPQIHEDSIQYLEQEVPRQIQGLDHQFSLMLGSEYPVVIIEDIKKQLDERIRYYMNQSLSNTDPSSRDQELVRNTIVKKMKKDIYAAIEGHFKPFFGQGGNL
jgi:spore germination protein PC